MLSVMEKPSQVFEIAENGDGGWAYREGLGEYQRTDLTGALV